MQKLRSDALSSADGDAEGERGRDEPGPAYPASAQELLQSGVHAQRAEASDERLLQLRLLHLQAEVGEVVFVMHVSALQSGNGGAFKPVKMGRAESLSFVAANFQKRTVMSSPADLARESGAHANSEGDVIDPLETDREGKELVEGEGGVSGTPAIGTVRELVDEAVLKHREVHGEVTELRDVIEDGQRVRVVQRDRGL